VPKPLLPGVEIRCRRAIVTRPSIIRLPGAAVLPFRAANVADGSKGRILTMRSQNALALAGVLMAAIVSSAAAADTPLPRTLTVQGHAEVNGAPDSATISAGVTSEGKTAASALSANASSMNSVFAALKRLGVEDKNIQTSGLSVEPQYAPYNNANTDRQRIVGYQASNQVTVTIDHIANVGRTVDELVAAGANQMNGISFAIHDPKPLMADARAQAVDDAVARADVLAKAAHVSLGPILSIEDGIVERPHPIYAMRTMNAIAAAPAPSPVAAGQQSVVADVTIIWEIQ
jgi:uncharacterized protein YggE